MQSFSGSIRLAREHTISSSKLTDFRFTRSYPMTTGPGLSRFEPNSSVSDGVAGVNGIGYSIDCSKGHFFGLSPKFASRSPLPLKKFGSRAELLTSSNNNIMPLVSPFQRSPRPGLCQCAAVVPTLPSRCMTTMGNPAESIPQDSSPSVADLAPRIKFKRLNKTAKHIMQILDKEAVEEVRARREIPYIKCGYAIQLKVEVPENRRHVSTVKGIAISRHNAGLNTTFRLRRIVAGVGIESLFPLYSPNIKEIKVLDKKKTRRSKLYYLRDKMKALKKH